LSQLAAGNEQRNKICAEGAQLSAYRLDRTECCF
jgi:hypothetical protein